MRGTKNFHGDRLVDCSVRLTTERSLFTMMSNLPPGELERRISNIKDPDTRILAQAHADALMGDWDSPIKM